MIVNIDSRIVMLKMIISAHEFKKMAASSSSVGVYKILWFENVLRKQREVVASTNANVH